MKKHSYIGLDVHKESISIALAEAGRRAKCALSEVGLKTGGPGLESPASRPAPLRYGPACPSGGEDFERFSLQT